MQNRLDLNALADGDMLPTLLPPGESHSDWCLDYCAFRRFHPDTCARVGTEGARHGECSRAPRFIFVSPSPRPGDNAVAPGWVRAGLPGPPPPEPKETTP